MTTQEPEAGATLEQPKAGKDISWLAVGLIGLVSALLVACVAVWAITNSPGSDRAKTSFITDPELQKHLVGIADFPGSGWSAKPMEPKEMSASPDGATISPPECDYSDRSVSSLSGAGLGGFKDSPHSVVMVILTKDTAKLGLDDSWLESCGEVTVTLPQGSAKAHLARALPPESDADRANGLTMSYSLDLKGFPDSEYSDFADWSITVYTAVKGDIGVMTMTIGVGEKVKADRSDMDVVYQKQVAKLPG